LRRATVEKSTHQLHVITSWAGVSVLHLSKFAEVQRKGTVLWKETIPQLQASLPLGQGLGIAMNWILATDNIIVITLRSEYNKGERREFT
jgi:hypothetical protein